MLEFLKSNINWIKDIFVIVFTAIVTIVTVFTYWRAKDTLLQPIRNETIKKQSAILAELLDFFESNISAFESRIDLLNTTRVNVLMLLEEYGFNLDNKEELLQEFKPTIYGSIYCGNSEHVVKKIEIFITNPRDRQNVYHSKEVMQKKQDLLKKGIVNLEYLYITNKFSSFMAQLDEFIDNAFMPTRVITLLQNFSKSLEDDLKIILKEELEKFLIEYCKKFFEDKNILEFSPDGVYNSFDLARSHYCINTVVMLKEEIRRFLLIDKPWK
jgi:hypothetical protein